MPSYITKINTTVTASFGGLLAVRDIPVGKGYLAALFSDY